MLRILFPYQFAETDRRRQYGFRPCDAQNPIPVPICRNRSSTSIWIPTMRCSESYSRTNLPKPIVDVNMDSDHSMLRLLFPYQFAETDRRRQYGFRPCDAQNPIPVPICRNRSSTLIRIATIRCSDSYSWT